MKVSVVGAIYTHCPKGLGMHPEIQYHHSIYFPFKYSMLKL